VRIRFGPFVLDLDTRQLIEDKREIHLTPKAFDLLTMLVMDRPKVLSKAALQNRLWPDTFVAEANLSNLVAEIREALRDHAHAPTFIRTAHGFGYAFCGEATTLPDGGDPAPDSCGCWIEWGTRRFPLSAGQNVIGRDPDVEVRLDASTVSRRHASLVVKAVPAAVMGLVIDAKRKIESLVIGGPSMTAAPTAASSIWAPRATSATAPGTDPSLTYRSRSFCRSGM